MNLQQLHEKLTKLSMFFFLIASGSCKCFMQMSFGDCESMLQLSDQHCSFQAVLTGVRIPLKVLMCNTSMLEQFLILDRGATNMTIFHTELCDQPADVLQEAERHFFSQLDITKLLTVSAIKNTKELQYVLHFLCKAVVLNN